MSAKEENSQRSSIESDIPPTFYNKVGQDIIRFEYGVEISDNYVSGNDVILSLTNGGNINIMNSVGKPITFDDGNGNLTNTVFS